MPLSPTPPYDPQTPPPRGRALRREGAVIFSSAEQVLADAMAQSSSPLPESLLGRRTRADSDVGGPDDDPDLDLTPRASTRAPSISNVTAVVLRYASQKKLRPEQRDEVDSFLTVS
jgi:hypothetical protein